MGLQLVIHRGSRIVIVGKLIGAARAARVLT